MLITLLLLMLAFSGWSSQPPGVQIVRDTYGVPHIYAATDEAALYGFGYAQAEDHLLDMLQNYLAAEGRMAEFFGRAYLNSDIKARAVLSYSDEELLTTADHETVRLVSAFAQGINRYIREHSEELPGWARGFEVTAAQVLRFAHYAMISRSLNAAFKELRQGPATSGSALAGSLLPVEASNQWVIGASRTAEGAPIFLMDPHLPWSGMNRWYEAHLAGETLNVYGATFYGSPFITMGHNGKVAWSMTHNAPDLADVFVEELHPNAPTRYRTESGWAAMTVRQEVFRVKGRGAVTQEIYYTRNGWVVSLEPERNRALVAALEGLDLLSTPTQLLAMNRAESITEFREALKMHQLLLWNVMAADAQGNLFYLYNARLHRRSEAWGRAEWRPGWNPEARWSSEVIPFEELPQIENPAGDWMQNNNVMPWFVTDGLEMNPEDFPSYLVKREAELNDRGKRASEVLSQAQDWRMTDALALTIDTLVMAAAEHLPQLFAAYETAPPERQEPLAAAIELLKAWNRRADVDQPGMTLFYFWWHRPARERERDPLAALEAAVGEMERLYGSIDVPWGQIHRIRRGSFDLPIAGEQSPPTLWMASGTMDKRGIIYTDHGSSFTILVRLAPRVEAYSLLPYGNSEDPSSPHYADQVPLKSRGELKRTWFYEDEVSAHAESVDRLSH
ncbi:MAG TPA: penicillin acylase family protein [Caldilineae bacterium]|nr:penicillin acylase family protein [Caldilineae bacterium]